MDWLEEFFAEVCEFLFSSRVGRRVLAFVLVAAVAVVVLLLVA